MMTRLPKAERDALTQIADGRRITYLLAPHGLRRRGLVAWTENDGWKITDEGRAILNKREGNEKGTT